MANDKQQKWDRRYRQQQDKTPCACAVLQQYQYLLPAQGRALDLACGLGGNALLLAEAGLEVEAWDISSVGLDLLATRAQARQLNICRQQRDVEQQPPASASFDIICVSFFLHRDSCQQLAAALKPGGLLFYQTFNTDNQEGPCNPKFVLQRNELLALFAGLEIVAYLENDGQQLSGQSWLVARRR
jgi:2-polyprenyl-3-methyl-5-hydroxy-6-metoxy-1,4-benzoquinol methylase